MSIYDQFMEEAIFDAEYQDYLYHQQHQKQEMWSEAQSIEQQAYEIMCEQANKDQEFYETCMQEKEYRSISEWDFIKEMIDKHPNDQDLGHETRKYYFTKTQKNK